MRCSGFGVKTAVSTTRLHEIHHVTESHTSTLADALGCLDADAAQTMWTRLAGQLSLAVLVTAGRTWLAPAAHRVVPRGQTARH